MMRSSDGRGQEGLKLVTGPNEWAGDRDVVVKFSAGEIAG